MQSNVKKYFISTPIFYVNANPHLGHIYSVLLADAQNRFQKLKNPGKSTKFCTGTDEHGLKIQQASEKNGFSSPKDFCDQVSGNFRETFKVRILKTHSVFQPFRWKSFQNPPKLT
jgi:methionyl-tRNA synthetase